MATNAGDLNRVVNPGEEGLESPLAALRKGTRVTKSYSFPLEEVETEQNHFLKFIPISYDRKNRNTAATKTSLAMIALPIPANLSTAYGANWGEVDLGLAGKKIAEGGGAAGDALMHVLQGEGGKAWDAVGKMDMSKLMKDFTPTIIRNIVQSLGDVTGIKAIEGAQLFAGKAINPHQAVLFQGVGFRTHTFTYNFVAKSSPESFAIRDIINVFKYGMHPDIEKDGTGTVFEFPYEWIIEFSKRIKPFMYAFTPCVLTGFNVTYNGVGIPAFYEQTGAPIQVNISLTFKEVEILTKTKLEKEFSDQAFGIKTQTGVEREAADASIQAELRGGGG